MTNSDIFILRPDEVVNQPECDAFVRELRRGLDEGARVIVLECANVRYLNSRAVGSLIEALMKLIAHGGTIRLVGAGEGLRRCFEAVGILPLMEVYPTLEEALAKS